MAYTTIDNPELYFQNKLYTGDGNSSKAITLDGDENMQPDWVWVKSRNTADYDHQATDSVRGVQKTLKINTDGAEDSNPGAGGIGSFDTNGFTIAEGSINNTNMNNSGTTYVAWNWKAGTSFTNDASSTGIGTIDSTGSASTTAGFSIVSFTGTGSNGTIKHGLSTALNAIVIRRRDSGNDWRVGGTGLTSFVKHLNLNTSASESDLAAAFNSTAPTSSVFSVGTSASTNASSGTFIALCFHNVQGYSKFGKYTGNEDASDPTYIYTGFRPSFVMVKKLTGSTDSWFLHDNLRDGFNTDNEYMRPNEASVEGSGVNRLNIFSNGFNVPTTDKSHNADGVPYIYWAFAESPFVNSSGVPTNAR